MEYIVWFCIYFVVMLLMYYFLVVRRCALDKRRKKPSEVELIIKAYKLDINKFSYRKFLMINGLVVALEVSLIGTFIPLIKGFVFQLLFAFIILIPVTFICSMLLGKYYQKKQDEDNSDELKNEKKFIERKNKKKKIKEEKKEKQKNKKVKNKKER